MIAGINRYVDKTYQQALLSLIKVLKDTGRKFVEQAQSMTVAEGGFRDSSGNLRSSIGYFLYNGENLIDSYFDGNSEGKEAAIALANRVSRTNGLQLLGVAGMDYAEAVESRGLNVITVQANMVLVNLRTILINNTGLK